MGEFLEIVAGLGLLGGFLHIFAPSRRKYPFHW
jgi:hypothetical protein